jgi:hypothetical protein
VTFTAAIVSKVYGLAETAMSGPAVAHEHVYGEDWGGEIGKDEREAFGSCLSEGCIYTVFCICDNRKSVDTYCII